MLQPRWLWLWDASGVVEIAVAFLKNSCGGVGVQPKIRVE